MVLSDRLLEVARLVTKGNVLIDVGTDHGYLPIYLIKKGCITNAVAMDINRGPLSRAKAHIKEHGLLDYIDTRLSDGVSALRENEGDTLAVAGMGGNLMIKILEDGRDKITHFKELILQPQSDIMGVRDYLLKNGFSITKEVMVLDTDKYYTIIKALKGSSAPYTFAELKYGKDLLEEKDSVLLSYLDKEKHTLSLLKDKLLKSDSANGRIRLKQVEEDLRLIEQAMGYYH